MSSAPVSPYVLLLGPEAERLVSRLEVSGYRGLPEGELPALGEIPMAPDVVILSPGSEARIPELRTLWRGVTLLLGVKSNDVAGRCHCLASGADDYWLTGLGASDLLTRLRIHLQRKQATLPAQADGPAPSLLSLEDLQVDLQSGQVWRGKRSVSLTPREFQLLLLMLKYQGEVVSRERILTEIWVDQNLSSSNVIEVYVRYLRRKLEAAGEIRLIHTVRGRGYCLSAEVSSQPPNQTDPPAA